MFDYTRNMESRTRTEVLAISLLYFLNRLTQCAKILSIVIYEGGSVMAQARSLWRLELARTKWSGGFINWSHPMRIRHITTGRYLGVNDNKELVLVGLVNTESKLFQKIIVENLLPSFVIPNPIFRRQHFVCAKRKTIKKLYSKTKIWK